MEEEEKGQGFKFNSQKYFQAILDLASKFLLSVTVIEKISEFLNLYSKAED